MKKAILAMATGSFVLAGSILPANAQYHQNYGGSRVVNQNQTGLYHNDPSYISSGTLSRSAQGKQAGMTSGFAPSALPSTSWGGYIRNPGDDIYTGANGAMRNGNGSMVYADEIVRANMVKAAQAQQRRMRYQQQMYRQPQGNYYVPGSNGGAASYGGGGVASYGSYGGR